MKDLVNAVGYFVKASYEQKLMTISLWELGFTWFLGLYTIGGMFSPFLAYAVMFSCLIENKWQKFFYIIASLTISPLIAPIR